MAPMKEHSKTPEKEQKKNRDKQSSDVEFETLVIRMLKEHSEDLSSIKKIQSEILIEGYTNRNKEQFTGK